MKIEQSPDAVSPYVSALPLRSFPKRLLSQVTTPTRPTPTRIIADGSGTRAEPHASDEPGLGWVRSETQPEQPSLYCTCAAKSQLFRFAGTAANVNTNQFVVPAVFSLPLPLSSFRSN